MPRIQDIGAFSAVREAGLAKLVPAVPRIAVGMGTCGRGNGAEGLYSAFAQAIELSGASLVLVSVGCFGACFQEPLVSVRLPGNPLVILRKCKPMMLLEGCTTSPRGTSVLILFTARSKSGTTLPDTSVTVRDTPKCRRGAT